MRVLPALAVALLLTAPVAATAAEVTIVAAENVYGDIARQIGGDTVKVSSIMTNPDQDPHLFETAPSVVRQLGAAQIVIANGADYDPWVDKLLKVSPRADRTVINVATLAGRKAGDNPHLWYDPKVMPLVANAVADAMAKADPAHAADYATRLKAALASLERVNQRVAELRTKLSGQPVTATEPVFGLMADALGLTMRNERFQLAVMNDTEPSARDLAAFESDLKQRKVKALIYNKQVSEKLTRRLVDIARKAKVPVIGVTETQPANVSYVDWMLGTLDTLDKALSGAAS